MYKRTTVIPTHFLFHMRGASAYIQDEMRTVLCGGLVEDDYKKIEVRASGKFTTGYGNI